MEKEKLKETTREILEHTFTKEELDVMHKALAQRTAEMRHLIADKAVVSKQYASDIQKADAEISSLADKLNAGTEHRPMNAVIQYN